MPLLILSHTEGGPEVYEPRSNDQSTQAERRGSGRAKGEVSTRAKARVVAVAVLAAVLFIFVVQNAQRVQVDFLFLHGTPPLWIALLVTALIGGLIGQVVALGVRRRRAD